MIFNNDDIEKISQTLGAEPKAYENAWTWNLVNQGYSKPLVFTIYSDIQLGDNTNGSMVSVQTIHGYYELHDIKSFMYFEPDEIIFITHNEQYLSSLIIGKQCTCSLYSNISVKILKSDFADLHPAVLLSAMQLSIAESSLSD